MEYQASLLKANAIAISNKYDSIQSRNNSTLLHVQSGLTHKITGDQYLTYIKAYYMSLV